MTSFIFLLGRSLQMFVLISSMSAHITLNLLWHLSENSSDMIPSLSRKTLVMAVPAEACTLSLHSLIIATVPIYHSPTSISEVA